MMARLPGDPSVAGWLLFAVGFRLPAKNRDWVRHELTDAGWRGRTVLRHLAVIIPVCVFLAVPAAVLLPAPLWLILATTPTWATPPTELTRVNPRWSGA
jgi:hypothetical protein